MAPLKYSGIVYFTIKVSKNQVASAVAEKKKPMQKCPNRDLMTEL